MNCPDCGTPLKIVDDKWFCPNHGFVDLNTDENEETKPSYLG